MGRFVLLKLIFLLPLFSWAEFSFEARVEPEVVGVGQNFNLYVSVTTSGEALNLSDPKLPGIAGIKLVGQSQQSQVIRKFVNGKFENLQTQIYVFTYLAITEGMYTIAPIKINVNGGEKTLSTAPFHVTAAGGGGRGHQGRQNKPSRPDDDTFFPNDEDGFTQLDKMEETFNQLLRRRLGDPKAVPPGTVEGDSQGFFIEVDLEKTKAYVGEPIKASWYLYTRGQVRDIDTLKYPDLSGFWKEDIEVATRLAFETVTVNGIPYNRALLVSFMLYPIKPGTSVIDPYTAKCTIVSIDSLNLFGLSRPQTLTRSSNSIKIEVLPLPEQNKPADFSGGVGQFNMFASIDASSFKTNTPFFYKLRFEGKGNAKTIEVPKIASTADLELYDTKSTSGFERSGISHKEFELTFVPRKSGEIVVPKISLSFFNPQTKSYYRKETEAIPINVELGKDDLGVAPKKLDQDQAPQVKVVLPEFITEYSKPLPWNKIFNRYTWLISYGFAFLLLLGKSGRELGWWERQVTLESQLQLRIRTIQGLINKGDWRKVGQEMTNAIYFVLGEISGVGGGSMEVNKLLAEAPPSIRNELGESIKQIIYEAEVLGFAPETVVGAAKEKSNLRKSLTNMENILKRGISLYRA